MASSTKIFTLVIAPFSFFSANIVCEFALVPDYW